MLLYLPDLLGLLEKIHPESLPAAADQFAKQESERFAQSGNEFFLKQEQLRRERLVGDSLEQDIAERKAYASRIFGLICAWLAGVFFLLFFCAVRDAEFELPENVLLAVVGSTTLNVLGIFYVVTKYLFPAREKKPRP